VQERKMCGSSCRGQEPAANTFALDLNEGLTVDHDLVGIAFMHQIVYPMLCVCSTTDFESAVLVSMPKHRMLGFGISAH